jgi:uncharacterized protein with PQ loop repeat
MLPSDAPAVTKSHDLRPARSLERVLRASSVVTMLMTVPQVLAIWLSRNAGGVSLVSWVAYLFSACLWFVYGLRKRDPTIYLACVGWILLDVAVVVGTIIYR